MRKERQKFPTYFDNRISNMAVQRVEEKKANALDFISSLHPILCPSLSWIGCANPGLERKFRLLEDQYDALDVAVHAVLIPRAKAMVLRRLLHQRLFRPSITEYACRSA